MLFFQIEKYYIKLSLFLIIIIFPPIFLRMYTRNQRLLSWGTFIHIITFKWYKRKIHNRFSHNVVLQPNHMCLTFELIYLGTKTNIYKITIQNYYSKLNLCMHLIFSNKQIFWNMLKMSYTIEICQDFTYRW
jgi:hypothetical protein